MQNKYLEEIKHLKEQINNLERLHEELMQSEEELQAANEQLEAANMQLYENERLLKKQEALLNEVGKIAKIGGWEMDMKEGGKATWTKGTYDIVEVDYDSPVPGFEEHFLWYLPEYREMINKKMNDLLQFGKILNFEAPFKTAKGNIKWGRALGEAVFKNRKCVKLRGTFQDISEQKKIEQSLKESEEKYKILFDSVPIMLGVLDMNGNYVQVNEAVNQKLGYTNEVLKGHNSFQFVHEEDRDRVINDFNDAIKKGIGESVYRYKDAKGEYRIFKSGGARILNTGNFILFSEDITERLEAQQELESKNEYIQRILDDFPIGIATNEIDSLKVLYINQKFSEIYGWPPEDFPTTPEFFNKVFPDKEYREKIQKEIMEDINSGDPNRMQWENLRIITKNGEERIVNGYNIPLPEQNIMVSTVQDVTDRQNAEKEIRANEKKFSNIINHGHELHYIHDTNNMLQYVSKQCIDFFGFTEEEMKQEWTNFATDNPINTKAVASTLKALKTGKKQAPYLAELKRKDGSVFIAEVTESPYKDENGNVIGIVGALRDVTERIKAEAELKKHREHLEDMVKERTIELENKNKELEKFNKLFVGREFRIKELREKIKELENKLASQE